MFHDMPSPFPGMDPYLEGDLWQEFHATLASAIRAQLVGVLPDRYAALLAKRFVLDRGALGIVDLPSEPKRTVYPDVHVTEPPNRIAETAAMLHPTVVLPSPMIEEVPQVSIEVRDVAERRLVTLIEILSPANKRPDGRRDYEDRRLDLLATATHLVELDLLRGGQRIRLLVAPPVAPYYAYVSRADRRPWTEVWPLALRQRLPAVPVPLLAPDPDVALDLQAAVDACFALVRYERLIDYSEPPPGPAMYGADEAWTAQCLAEYRPAC